MLAAMARIVMTVATAPGIELDFAAKGESEPLLSTGRRRIGGIAGDLWRPTYPSRTSGHMVTT